MTSYHIRHIQLEDCLQLRRDILWPSFKLQDCMEPGDEDATHYGYLINDQVISCLSVFYRTPNRRQIRKFATESHYQNRGIGSTLFKTVLQELKKDHVASVYLNARSTATRFYEKFNFTYFDTEFTKNNVTFVPMELDLTKANIE
ncbi:Ribosomal protein S18 acetylase RimI and related acetyltransferases (RimI) (PDB:1GHE) [Commensalibacter communis]|uniref:Ribosomal protein S18 acetylase RimI and related acetyltransferases (RimI) n=1 Tax=Commensalibacter communis TaxID=2972786 RepID=A0A9W4TQ65_9PROT|nr:GNAT family N-acetyltransferase [Commensalibacter communis]CAI3922677.1 Ribosomal protein S18 acetylase RimI and related acetyltransferases (RimI) (PDB:1GHE) [Commensalibacter communis]CAI3944320.1 Ribosomal protein S18 acetylase RimI and related acetyltransferases (RimI) (PDB:1GHE) [Commensalibacter communis]CAI3945740.1 Ribosomal protein S18 acetylase RimI and related acetyltransferases (RimI) (PDB:1GHE) [Commensalibacter communis]CAI3947033.1 Ribosomal protein S18 acetylase RimI and relat